MKIPGIYMIQSIVKPEKVYIGSAVNLNYRWINHVSKLKSNTHANRKLQNHFNKYGESDLIFIVIEPCLPEFLLIREQYYIDSLDPWFNICPIAGSSLGIKRTHRYIEKMKLRECSKETRDKLKIICKGNKGRKGRPLTEDHKQKIRKAQEGKNNSMYGKEPWNKGKKWNKRKHKIA